MVEPVPPPDVQARVDGLDKAGMGLRMSVGVVAFSYYLGDMRGQIFVFFILTVAAAESAIGLAILVQLFRNKSNINVDELNQLKG